jgi:cell division septation protein DedD
MVINKTVLVVCCAMALGLVGCSRQQSDWEKTRAANTTESYEQFLKKYPSGEFTAQAQARVKELYEEHDWQKARDTDTVEAYQAFLKQYPEGKWAEEARIRVENFALAQAPSGTPAPGSPTAGAAATGTPAAGSAASGAAAAGSPATTTNAGSAGTGTTDDADETPGDEPAAAAPPKPAAAMRPAPKAHADAAPPHAAKSVPAKPAVHERSGAYAIQLGAFKSGADAANKRWAYLKGKYPELLSGLNAKVASSKSASGKIYRLQSTGLGEKRARAICRSLKAKSQPCVIIAPAGH